MVARIAGIGLMLVVSLAIAGPASGAQTERCTDSSLVHALLIDEDRNGGAWCQVFAPSCDLYPCSYSASVTVRTYALHPTPNSAVPGHAVVSQHIFTAFIGDPESSCGPDIDECTATISFRGGARGVNCHADDVVANLPSPRVGTAGVLVFLECQATLL